MTMTKYQSAQTVALAALIALGFSLAANARTAFQAHSNCQKIESLKSLSYQPLLRAYQRVQRGENDQDYKRVYGTQPKVYKGKTYPRWQAIKLEELDEGKARLAEFRPHHCGYLF